MDSAIIIGIILWGVGIVFAILFIRGAGRND